MTGAVQATVVEKSSEDLSGDAVGQMLACAHSLRDKRIEHAYVFNEHGKMLYSLKGERARIRFDHRDLFRLANTIFMHNHPAGGAFSLADLYVACAFEMLAMIVVTDSFLYTIKPPYAGQHFTRAHYTDIARCFTIRSRMLPLSEQLTVGDRVWFQVARDLDMEFRKYSFVKRPGST
ncbi:hypothetical protein [Methanoculleus sp.]|uniref:hypothetical protein n=1 Tax=Methanoculleus sp. TaxID=90427 RepID=UPI001BD63BEC|nr:hypothetical protein [Methanoculleus sp.]